MKMIVLLIVRFDKSTQQLSVTCQVPHSEKANDPVELGLSDMIMIFGLCLMSPDLVILLIYEEITWEKHLLE